MRRKLLVLNVVLGLLVVYAGWQLHSAWRAAQARERAILHRPVKPLPPPPYTPAPQVTPVVPSGYADIAEKTLFDKSRNPTVVVEVPPPPPPPPPKPMPPLPVYHGMMNIGDGPTAVLSLGGNSPHQAVHPGEEIGQFKLVDVNTEEIVFEWDGKPIHKKLEELEDHGAPQQSAAVARTEAAPAVAAAAAPVQSSPTGPGADAGPGMKSCTPGDSSPPGTVADGFRKIVSQSPFGPICRWEAVGR